MLINIKEQNHLIPNIFFLNWRLSALLNSAAIEVGGTLLRGFLDVSTDH